MWAQTYFKAPKRKGQGHKPKFLLLVVVVWYFSYNAINARQLLVKMFVSAKLPIVFVENEFFEEFVQNAPCSQFKKISTNTARGDAIRLWQKWKGKYKKLICRQSW